MDLLTNSLGCAQSVGVNLFYMMIQSLIQTKTSFFKPSAQWPKDYGPQFNENGKRIL